MDKEKAADMVRLTFEDYDAKEAWGIINLTNLSKDEFKYGMEQNRELSIEVILKIYEWNALRGRSRKFVNDELKEKGVPLPIIKETMLADENNWFEAALQRCKKYEDQFHTTARELRRMLKNDGFTDEEIKYSLFNLNADWKEEALFHAIKHVMKNIGLEAVLEKLEYEGFKKAEIEYAKDNLNDVKEEFEKIKEIIEKKLEGKGKI